MNITREDTDGIRSILNPGELAYDNRPAGNDIGRIYTGDGVQNKAIAWKGELVPFRTFTQHDAVRQMPKFPGEIIFMTDANAHIFYDESKTSWRYLRNWKIVPVVGLGTGSPGLYVESWEDETEITTNWVSNVFGTLDGTGRDTGKWNTRSGPTPSDSTGPNGPQEDSVYMYAEVSSGGDSTDFNLQTSNFKELTTISGYYCLYGTKCGTFELIGYNQNVGDIQLFIVSGDSGSSDWVFFEVDVTGQGIESLNFNYYGAGGWQGDFALDNITLASV